MAIFANNIYLWASRPKELPEEASRTLNELRSLIKTRAIIHGQNLRDRTSVFNKETNPNSIFDIKYSISPDNCGNFDITVKRRPKTTLSKLDVKELGITIKAGSREFEACFKIDSSGTRLLEGNRSRIGSNYERIERRLSPRFATMLLKAIVEDLRQRLSNETKSDELLSLEEYFAASLDCECPINDETEMREPRYLLNVAGKLYQSDYDIFKHSDHLGAWFREDPIDFQKNMQSLSESARQKIETINERLEKEWLQAKIQDAIQTLYSNVRSIHTSILGSSDPYDNVSDIVLNERSTYFFKQIITQDRMEKFETVPCVGTWDGKSLEILLLDEGMGIKRWKSPDLSGLSPKMVFDDICPKLLFGGTLSTGQTLPGSDLEVGFIVQSDDLRAENFFDQNVTTQSLIERLNYLEGMGKDIYEMLTSSFPESRAILPGESDLAEAPTLKLANIN